MNSFLLFFCFWQRNDHFAMNFILDFNKMVAYVFPYKLQRFLMQTLCFLAPIAQRSRSTSLHWLRWARAKRGAWVQHQVLIHQPLAQLQQYGIACYKLHCFLHRNELNIHFSDFLHSCLIPVEISMLISTWKKCSDHDKTRTCNLRIRSPTPYPLGHMVVLFMGSVRKKMCPASVKRDKSKIRKPWK